MGFILIVKDEIFLQFYEYVKANNLTYQSCKNNTKSTACML